MQLTDHFTLEEATNSRTAKAKGIDNFPADPKIIRAIQVTAMGMERVRKVLGDKPIQVTSWYRGQKLNEAVGGRPSSQHCGGNAVDFLCPSFGSVRQVFDAIKASNIVFDQMIVETVGSKEWVHISFSAVPRRVAMTYDGSKYVRVE